MLHLLELPQVDIGVQNFPQMDIGVQNSQRHHSGFAMYIAGLELQETHISDSFAQQGEGKVQFPN